MKLDLNGMYSLSEGMAWTHCHAAVNEIQGRSLHDNDAQTNNWQKNTPSITTSYTDDNAANKEICFMSHEHIKK
jgi:hypothetical protein